MMRWPRVFFAGYLFATTKCFGLLPMEVVLLVPAGLMLIHLTMLAVTLVKLATGQWMAPRGVNIFLLLWVGLWFFGMIYPVLVGDSNLLFALQESKHFLCYAGLSYLLMHRDHFDQEYLERLFTFMGVVLVFILILGRVFGIVPPGYFYHLEKDFIHVDHILYFTLALYFAFSRWISTWEPRHAALAAFLFIGLIIQGHRSVMFVALVQLPALAAMKGRWSMGMKLVTATIPIVLAGSALAGMVGFTNPIFERGVSILQTTEDDIMAGRERANLLRYALIAERPILGYGFINKNSSLGASVALQSTSRFNETLGVIDSGYVDLAIRFGILGTLLFLGAYAGLLLPYWMRGRALGPHQTSMLLLLTGCLAIHFTWAVLTYEHGIVGINVMIFILTGLAGKAAGSTILAPQAGPPSRSVL